MEPLIKIGKLGKPFGVKGKLRVFIQEEYFQDFQDRVGGNQALFVAVQDFYIPFFVQAYDDEKHLIQFKKVDPNKHLAELANGELYMPQTSGSEQHMLPFEGLTNYSVYNRQSDSIIGTILRIEEFPSQTMLILQSRDSDDEILIPLVESWIMEVQEEEKCIQMNLPEGLI